jgi:hypothetical protein
MKRQAFVFSGSNWRSDLAQKYSEWVNDLLVKYPNAKFEFHQSLGSFFWEHEESDWVEIWTLVIVTEP